MKYYKCIQIRTYIHTCTPLPLWKSSIPDKWGGLDQRESPGTELVWELHAEAAEALSNVSQDCLAMQGGLLSSEGTELLLPCRLPFLFLNVQVRIRPKSTPQLYRTPAWFLKLELGCLSLRSTVGAVSLPIFMFTEIQRCNFNRQKAVWMLSISFHKSFHKFFHIFPQVFPYLSIMNDLPALTALILAGATSLWGRELLNGAEPKTTAA